MTEIELLSAAVRRLASGAMSLDPSLLVGLAVPVVLTALTLSALSTLACALVGLAAAFMLSSATADGNVHALILWLSQWLIVVFALGGILRRRRERSRRRELAELSAQLSSLAASYESYFLQHARAGGFGGVSTPVLPLKVASGKS